MASFGDMHDDRINSKAIERGKMNIYDYFHSSDIAEYCKSIGHSFNPIEMAYIIDQSDKTINQKKLAFQELIRDYPDMLFHPSVDFKVKTSLHDYLRALVEYRANLLSKFEDATHTKTAWYSISKYDRRIMGLDKDPPFFGTFEELWEFLCPYWRLNAHNTVRIIRTLSKKPSNFVYVDYNANGEAMRIADNYMCYGRKMASAFPPGPGDLMHLFIDIPSPFREGDIVSIDSAPVVLKAVPHSAENYSKIESGSKEKGYLFKDRPNYPIYYYLDENGYLADSFPGSEHVESPFSQGLGISVDRLEYYKKPLKENEKLLAELSDFIKENGTKKAIQLFNENNWHNNPEYTKIVRDLGPDHKQP